MKDAELCRKTDIVNQMIGIRDEDLVACAMLPSDVPRIYEACIYVVIDQRNGVV